MSLDLNDVATPAPELPANYSWFPWNNLQTSAYARIFHEAFQADVDGWIFPTYRQYAACEHLVDATVSSRVFAKEASWLVGRILCDSKSNASRIEYAGAVQCVKGRRFCGEIQNLAVAPGFRGLRLGRALALQALNGFRTMGRNKISLEVTSENLVALRLYLSLGFKITSITYKETLLDVDGLSAALSADDYVL